MLVQPLADPESIWTDDSGSNDLVITTVTPFVEAAPGTEGLVISSVTPVDDDPLGLSITPESGQPLVPQTDDLFDTTGFRDPYTELERLVSGGPSANPGALRELSVLNGFETRLMDVIGQTSGGSPMDLAPGDPAYSPLAGDASSGGLHDSD